MPIIAVLDADDFYRNALCLYMRAMHAEWHIHDFRESWPFLNFLDTSRPDIVLASDGIDIFSDLSVRLSCPVILILPEGGPVPENLPDGWHVAFKDVTGRELVAMVSVLLKSESAYTIPIEKFGFNAGELAVLRLLTQGAANKEIARALNLTLATVKLHVRGVCRKTGMSNRVKAALFAQAKIEI